MHSTLQLEVLKELLRDQYGVPDGIRDRLDNINRLTYREAQEDLHRKLRDAKDQEDDE